jgi:hypothetical protein
MSLAQENPNRFAVDMATVEICPEGSKATAAAQLRRRMPQGLMRMYSGFGSGEMA